MARRPERRRNGWFAAAAVSAGTATAVTVTREQNNLAGAVLTGVLPGSSPPLSLFLPFPPAPSVLAR